MPIDYSLSDLLIAISNEKNSFIERNKFKEEPNLIILSQEMVTLLKLAVYDITTEEEPEIKNIFGMKIIEDNTIEKLKDIKVYHMEQKNGE